MTEHKQKYGFEGEQLAVAHLKKIGYKIVARNVRTKIGEIDIIAKHKGQIVFAEVKTRQTRRFGHPKLAVTIKKQRKISMVALAYLKKYHTLQTSARFDVITVQLSGSTPIIEVFQNAFELAYG